MKQETQTPDSKEGLHTQGEELPLKIHERNGEIHIDRNDFYYHGTGIAVIDSTLPEEEQKRVADIIVKAVNERKALLDENKKMRETMEWIKNEILSTPNELRDALLGMIIIKIRKALKQ